MPTCLVFFDEADSKVFPGLARWVVRASMGGAGLMQQELLLAAAAAAGDTAAVQAALQASGRWDGPSKHAPGPGAERP